jgi:uncharacterized protein YndB with AHSA1/START domain
MSNTQITVSATIDAPLDKVWKYWTMHEHIINWNYASDDWHCPQATNNCVEGGAFCFAMAAKDGSFQFDFEGTYTEVIFYNKIAYTMPDNRTAKIYFEETENGTLVTEMFDAETMNPIDMQQAGWQAILNNFKRYTEKG